MEKAVEFIRNNYSNEILVSDIARYVCINRSYLYTLFQKYLHTSPQNYLSSCRITRALELLSYTDLSIETVAFSCGYRNAEVFTKAFRQKQGMTPSAYRKSSALTRLLTLHMFRDLSDFIITKSFFHEQEEMLWKTVKMLDGVS